MHVRSKRAWLKSSIVIKVLLIVGILVSTGTMNVQKARAIDPMRYIVIFSAVVTASGVYELGGDYNTNHPSAVSAVNSAGGTIVSDMSRQIAVMVVESNNTNFVSSILTSPLVEDVGLAYSWKEFPTFDEALANGQTRVVQTPPANAPGVTPDPLQQFQWALAQIRAPQAHALHEGSRKVFVGVLDTGIDPNHLDFVLDYGSNGTVIQNTNVDPNLGRDFTKIGVANPYVDSNGHGTSVAGVIGAQINGYGMTGTAPNVTLVPIKVCDSSGFCYSDAVIQGITYSGDVKLSVINMSFGSDEEDLVSSTINRCTDMAKQRVLEEGIKRAITYIRGQGVTPVAAIGNSGEDIAVTPTPTGTCDIVPAETPGVIGVGALDEFNGLAPYSNYGLGVVDVVAPAGVEPPTNNCMNSILAPIPGNAYACGAGTSAAAPFVTGVAALIISKHGSQVNTPYGHRIQLGPGSVESRLYATAVDMGATGEDKCFGKGRVDALRAVQNTTTVVYSSGPACTR